MINFFQIFSVLIVLVAVSSFDQVHGEGRGLSKSLIGGSGNGEVVDGSGTGEMLEEMNDWPPECTSEFQKEKDHTMCIYFDDKRVTKSGVSYKDKIIIVALHNHLRGRVTPPATDLSKLVWDDKIAAVAQKWAKQCRLGHDDNRNIPSYGLTIGQNAAAGSSNWRRAVMGWYNEVQLFKYGKDPNVYLGKDGFKKIGHYTQVVRNTTYRIGCGYAECSSTRYRRYYVCNYGKGQPTNAAKPYTKGKRCSACPNSCKKGVCDCRGKICLNGGKLDIDRCTCTCGRTFIGASCETVHCPASLKDRYGCGTHYKPSDCAKFTNVPIDCPWMCGVCGPEGATPPPVFKSDFGCTYTGQRASKADCKTYGNKGADTWACASNGGQYNCGACTKFYNIKYQFCPVMCGICAP